MLRGLIAILILANVLAFATSLGAFGPVPIASSREPNHLNRQIHPESLQVRPVSAADAADQAVVGGPAPQAPISTSALPQ